MWPQRPREPGAQMKVCAHACYPQALCAQTSVPPRGSPESRFQLERPETAHPHTHTWTCPGAGRQAKQGPLAQPRGCENLSSRRGEVPAARRTGQGAQVVKRRGRWGPGDPGQARQGASHVWTATGATAGASGVPGRQAEKRGHSSRSR